MQVILFAALLLTQDDQSHYSELTTEARITIPGGTLANGAGSSQTWGNTFSTGYGFEGQYSYLWHLAPQLHGGLYAGFSIDEFSGKKTSFFQTGVGTIQATPDTLQMVGFEVGGRFRETLGKVFVDEHIGIGTAVYSKDDATFTFPNGASGKGEAIKATSAFLFDLGARIGIALDEHVDVALGVGFQLNGAPRTGSAFISGTKFKSQENTLIVLGFNFNF